MVHILYKHPINCSWLYKSSQVHGRSWPSTGTTYVPCAHTCLRREQHLNVFQVVVLVQISAVLRLKASQVDTGKLKRKKTSLKWHDYTWPHRPSMVLIWKRFQVLCIIHIRFVMIFFDKSRCFQQNQNQHWPSWWSKAMGTADSIRAPWLERKPSWKIIPTGSTSSIFLERYWRSRGHWQTLNSKKHNHPQMTQHARKHRPC